MSYLCGTGFQAEVDPLILSLREVGPPTSSSCTRLTRLPLQGTLYSKIQHDRLALVPKQHRRGRPVLTALEARERPLCAPQHLRRVRTRVSQEASPWKGVQACCDGG